MVMAIANQRMFDREVRKTFYGAALTATGFPGSGQVQSDNVRQYQGGQKMNPATYQYVPVQCPEGQKTTSSYKNLSSTQDRSHGSSVSHIVATLLAA